MTLASILLLDKVVLMRSRVDLPTSLRSAFISPPTRVRKPTQNATRRVKHVVLAAVVSERECLVSFASHQRRGTASFPQASSRMRNSLSVFILVEPSKMREEEPSVEMSLVVVIIHKIRGQVKFHNYNNVSPAATSSKLIPGG